MFAKIESILLSKVTKFFIYTLLGLYLWFMIISPFVFATCEGFSCRWQSALDTWQNWQSLNAAVIACISTLIIIHNTRISEQNNAIKRRNYAKAFYQINQCTLLHALISGMFDFTRGITEKYNVEQLNSDRFSIKDCPLYMTDPEIEKYKKSKIEFKLFVSG